MRGTVAVACSNRTPSRASRSMWGVATRAPVAAQHVGTQGVERDQDDTERGRCGLPVREDSARLQQRIGGKGPVPQARSSMAAAPHNRRSPPAASHQVLFKARFPSTRESTVQNNGGWAVAHPPKTATDVVLDDYHSNRAPRRSWNGLVEGRPTGPAGLRVAEVRVRRAERDLGVVVVVQRILGVEQVEHVREQDDAAASPNLMV